MTGPAGVVTDTFRYLPFGEVAERTGTTDQPFQFQGAWGLRTDPDGLVDARARRYDPTLGRFLSEDPQLFAAANATSYASSDPINRIDASGEQDSQFLGWLASPEKYLGFDASGSGVSNTANGLGLLASAAEAIVSGNESALRTAGNELLAAGSKVADGVASSMGRVRLPSQAITDKWKDLLSKATKLEDGGKNMLQAAGRSKLGASLLKGLGGALNGVQALDAIYRQPDGWNIVRQSEGRAEDDPAVPGRAARRPARRARRGRPRSGGLLGRQPRLG